MHDRDIVAAIVAGDPAGLAAAYDTYAQALHAYCRTLLAEPADAADAVQDTFVIAAARLDQLRDWDRLRPWLYAVARNECHRRLRSYARQAELDAAGEVTDATADVGGPAERRELQALVLAAIGGLNHGDREIIELNLRHELDGADLADALGVPVNQAHALVSRARAHLERSLGALLVARTGRRQCAELDQMLSDWGGELTILLRKRVARHIDHCDICGSRKRRELSPAMLLSILPLAVAPVGLRNQVLRLVSDHGGDAARYRAHVAARAEPFAQSGFPVQVVPAGEPGEQSASQDDDWPDDGPGPEGPAGEDAYWEYQPRPRRPRALVLGSAAALILLAGVGSASYVLIGGSGPAAAHKVAAGDPVATVDPPAPVTTAPSPDPGPTTSSGTPTPTPAPPASTSVPAAPPPAPSTSAAPTRRPTPRPSSSKPAPSPTSTPTRKPATISASPLNITLDAADDYASTFTLTASNGPVTYKVTAPAGLSVSSPSGTVQVGTPVTIQVSVTAGAVPKSGDNPISVSPDAITVDADYEPPATAGLPGLVTRLGL
ncbi:MAG TPA: sigma-70 family RNA polymerase sigma factor [Streptosporangiaceae bacterium]|nr:sigma-70 family RNA polymerase sigma factor [Streptosporangiaceae bacterium]